ncbi:MAG: MATE family efflux transporter [Bacteroidaceae bacterium]|nr:MATE family efflux transporter [Bacteroidaceae bacterium]
MAPQRLDFDNMSTGHLFRKIFFPTLMGMFAGSVMNVTDGIFVGRRIGSDALAAINITAPVFMLVTGIALMFGIGASVRASIALAEGRKQEADREITSALAVSSAIVVIMSVIFMLFPNQLGSLFGSTQALIPLVREYMLWITPGMLFSCIMFSGMFYVRLDGAPKFAMWCELLSTGLNILLDYLFIYPLNMGIMGAAAASSISCIVGGTMILIYMLFFTKRIHLINITTIIATGENIANRLWKQCKLGLSGLLGEVGISLMLVSGNYVFVHLAGEDGVAAYSIACYCTPLFFMINNAIAQAAQPIVSYDYGARRRERVRSTLHLSLTVAITCSIVTTILICLFAEPLVKLFVDEKNCTTFDIAREGMPLFALGLLFMAINITFIGYLQSVKCGFQASVFTALRAYVFLIISFVLLPEICGIKGAWLAIPTAEALTSLCIILFATIRLNSHILIKKQSKNNDF